MINKKAVVTVIPFVIGALSTIPKGLVKGAGGENVIGGRAENIQKTALLSSVRILRKVPET